MSQVIIYQNPTLPNVCVCRPTGEISIEQVLVKDCPSGAIIVDDSSLPQGDDELFFDCWRLNGSSVYVDFQAAQTMYLSDYNKSASSAGQTRFANSMAGVPNTPDDAVWRAALDAGRASIASATNTTQLLAVPMPTATTGA